MKIAMLVKLGAFLAVAGLFAAMEIGTLTGPHVGTTHTYYAYFDTPDGVSGLRSGNPVRVAGVSVGKVTGIELVNAQEARVEFTANENQRITTDTWAVVRYANLLGQRFLELKLQGSGTHVLAPGGTIPAQHTKPALSLTALFNGFRPLFAALTPQEVNELSQDIIDILQGQSGRIDDLVARTADLTSNLAQRDQVFGQVVDSLTTLLKTVAQHDTELGQVVTTLQALTAQLHADGPAIMSSLGSVDSLIGSVGSLLGQVNAQNQLPGDISDAAAVTGRLAKNTETLVPLVNGFVQAFGDFDRVSQNGNWINTYLCTAIANPMGTPQITAGDVVASIESAAGKNPTLANLFGGLLGGLPATKVPLTIPGGTVGNPAAHTQVCR